MDDGALRDAHHVLAASSLTDERIRVLKHGDTFALFDQHGEIRSTEWVESGVYHDGTRFLSRFQTEVDGDRPFLLSSTVRDPGAEERTFSSSEANLCNRSGCRRRLVFSGLYGASRISGE